MTVIKNGKTLSLLTFSKFSTKREQMTLVKFFLLTGMIIHRYIIIQIRAYFISIPSRATE
jgi:hypothetical protein